MTDRLQTAWLIGVALLVGCSSGGESVTVYTSQDQVYAEPILQRFEQETGVRVRAVYDSEAVKTVGLVNRLIAENKPSELRSVLEQRGVSNAPTRRAWSARCRMSRSCRSARGRGSGSGIRTGLGARNCRRIWPR